MAKPNGKDEIIDAMNALAREIWGPDAEVYDYDDRIEVEGDGGQTLLLLPCAPNADRRPAGGLS